MNIGDIISFGDKSVRTRKFRRLGKSEPEVVGVRSHFEQNYFILMGRSEETCVISSETEADSLDTCQSQSLSEVNQGPLIDSEVLRLSLLEVIIGLCSQDDRNSIEPDIYHWGEVVCIDFYFKS